ncbi:MAG: zinc ribbon domain-containing protein [Eubacterium sp.]|nr:zinc ribbon domain-containing protein [Eubacterium sp.]
MKNCKNCNAEINDDAKFCTSCGAEQDDVVTAESPVNETFSAAPAESVNSNVYFTLGTDPQPAAFYNGAASAVAGNAAPPKKKNGLKIVIAVIAILVVAGIAFVAKGALSGGSSIEPGHVDGNAYINSSVDLKINCPDGWKIVTGAELAESIGGTVDANGRVASDGGYYDCMLINDIGDNIIVMTIDGNIVDAAMSEDDFIKSLAASFASNGKVGQPYKTTIGGNTYNCVDTSSVSEGVAVDQTIFVIKEGKQYFDVLITTFPEYSEETASKLIEANFTAAN